jgi:hypothetical protein
VERFRVAAAFFAARDLTTDFRFLVAAFLPAAARFGDFLVVFRAVDFRAVDFRPVDFRAVVLRPVRFRVVAAFFAARDLTADFRFRVAAAFLAAAARFGDFRVVFRAAVFRAVVLRPVRFLVAAAFFPAATRFGDFRSVDLLVVFRAAVFFAVERFRVAAVFFAVERFRVAADFFADATRSRVSSCRSITAGSDMGSAAGIGVLEPSSCGRHGSGLGKSISSLRSSERSTDAGASSWSPQGHPRSWVIPPPPRLHRSLPVYLWIEATGHPEGG